MGRCPYTRDEVLLMITYEIPCLLGLEKLVADEIKRLGLADVRAENGRVLCQGSWADCARRWWQ